MQNWSASHTIMAGGISESTDLGICIQSVFKASTSSKLPKHAENSEATKPVAFNLHPEHVSVRVTT